MKRLTNSIRNKFNGCHRAYKYAYVDLIRPVQTSEALNFGTAMHKLLEAYWNGEEPSFNVVDDPYVQTTLKVLFEAYRVKYSDSDIEQFEFLGSEKEFNIPLMNPETGGVSKTWTLAGKIDAFAKRRSTGEVVILEHKTTSADIAPGSDYWKKLPIDGQVSGYYVGAKSLGYEVNCCIYDVIRKPSMSPLKATPIENRKYKKDGTLYANQRDTDETPEEWGNRLFADIAERPERYFSRVEIVRSENDLAEYLFDMWSVGREISDAERLGRFSRNPDNCQRYGACEYFDVCTGCANLEDELLFKKIENPNPELTEMK